MPIRFRCVNCDGLLSIARRKAGTLTKCPKCKLEVLVPDASTDLASGEAEADDNDLGEPELEMSLLNRGGGVVAPPAGALKLEQPQLLGGVVPGASLSAPTTTPVELPSEVGIYLSPRTVAILAGLFVVLLALSFATGFLLAS